MGNCTGIIYGTVKSNDGSKLEGIDVWISFVQTAEGGALNVRADDNLISVAGLRCKTTKAGEYVIPFFWSPTQVPGSIASAKAVRFNKDNEATTIFVHGQLGIGLDVRKLIGNIAPLPPSNAASAVGMFNSFYISATPDLKGLGILTRFTGSLNLLSVEQQGCYSKIDFVF